MFTPPRSRLKTKEELAELLQTLGLDLVSHQTRITQQLEQHQTLLNDIELGLLILKHPDLEQLHALSSGIDLRPLTRPSDGGSGSNSINQFDISQVDRDYQDLCHRFACQIAIRRKLVAEYEIALGNDERLAYSIRIRELLHAIFNKDLDLLLTQINVLIDNGIDDVRLHQLKSSFLWASTTSSQSRMGICEYLINEAQKLDAVITAISENNPPDEAFVHTAIVDLSDLAKTIAKNASEFIELNSKLQNMGMPDSLSGTDTLQGLERSLTNLLAMQKQNIDQYNRLLIKSRAVPHMQQPAPRDTSCTYHDKFTMNPGEETKTTGKRNKNRWFGPSDIELDCFNGHSRDYKHLEGKPFDNGNRNSLYFSPKPTDPPSSAGVQPRRNRP